MKNPQEVEFIKHQYRQKYWKIIKRWNLLTTSTGRSIEKFLKGGIYKASVQAEILQMFQEVKILNQDYRQKYFNIPKRCGCFLTKQTIENMNQLRMSRGRNEKSPVSPGWD